MKAKGNAKGQGGGTADLWAGHFVVRWSQPHCGDAPSSRVGYPSPPPVSFPTGDERFAIRGVSDPNLWPRHPRLLARGLLRFGSVTGRCGHAPSPRVGFPSPPQVSGPKGEERFAIRGAKTQKSSLRPATLFLEMLQRKFGA